MRRQHLIWMAVAVASVVALSGGALAAPALSVTPTEGPIETPLVLTGTGFTPGAEVGIEWQTMVGNRVSGAGFAEVSWPLTSVAADAQGGFVYEFKVPPDLGGPPHGIKAVQGETELASTLFTITRTATITPTSGPLGTLIELHMTGGGWTQYDNIVTVTYDNAYIGYMCSFNTQGNMTTWFPASGGAGLHTIDVWPALYTGPDTGPMPWKLPHLSSGDQPWMPPAFHFEFYITDMNGSVPAQVATPPPAAGDDSGPALLTTALAAAAVAGALEWPIRGIRRRARLPTAAAAALVFLAVFAVAAAPAQASDPAGDPPPITYMATGSGPALGVSVGTPRPGEAVQLTGTGLPVNTVLQLAWSTATVKSQAFGEKFKGWNVTPATWGLGAVQTDASGAFTLSLATPFDYGGIHQITALLGSVPVASTAVVIVPYFEVAGPTHVKAGEKVTVNGYGLGYEKYSGAWNVAYDNRLTGWVSGIESHGNVTFSLYAVGAPGQHFIDIGEGAVGFPYLNLWESPFQNRPPAHLSFVIDAEGSPPMQAPRMDEGSWLGGWVLGLLAGGAVTTVAVQGLRLGRAGRAAARAGSAKP